MDKNQGKQVLDTESILEILEEPTTRSMITCHHPNVYYSEEETEEE